jgi:hypothetical protein
MKTTSLFTAVLALLIAGCTTTLSPSGAANLDLAKTGVVLVTWVPGTSVAEKENRAYGEVHLRQVSGEGGERLDRVVKSTELMSLIELPPGRYRVGEFRMSVPSWKYDGMLGHQKQGNVFEFEVRPGEVTYLGNFHPVIDLRTHTDRFSFSASLFLEDQYGKTVGVFGQEYPALSSARIRDAAPKLIGWDLLAGVRNGVVKSLGGTPNAMHGGASESIISFERGKDPKAGWPVD